MHDSTEHPCTPQTCSTTLGCALQQSALAQKEEIPVPRLVHTVFTDRGLHLPVQTNTPPLELNVTVVETFGRVQQMLGHDCKVGDGVVGENVEGGGDVGDVVHEE